MLSGPGDRVNHPASRRDQGGQGRKRFPKRPGGWRPGEAPAPLGGRSTVLLHALRAKANAARSLCGLEGFACVVL